MHNKVRADRVVRVMALAIAATLFVPASFAERLPVYKLSAPKVDRGKSGELFRKAMGTAGKMEENENALIHRNGKQVLEVDKRSGHVFMGDMGKMWNPKLKPNLPDEARSKEIANKFLSDNGLLPTTDREVNVKFSHMSETFAGNDAPGRLDKTVLDRQVNYSMEINAKGPDGKDRMLPVLGGGGKMKVSIGDRGEVIGFHGGWRETNGIQSQEEVMPREAAEAAFKQKLGNAQLRSIKSELGYYAAPGFENQEVLAPVWAVSGEVQVGREVLPARIQLIAATKYGPNFDQGTPARGRTASDKGTPPDKDEQGQDTPLSWLTDFLISPAYADGYECGTEWIGTSQGLGGSAGNRQGFLDHCRAAGWAVNFDWGDTNAWENDWRSDDDNYVDGADLVFYTGHANQNGWVLNTPSDTALSYTEVGGGDIYGNSDMEWLIIAACGPMQSTHFTSNTTNAFDRWRNIFQGLHVFLGYGAVTYDNTSEGRRFMELTRAGWNVIDAWFRTAQEIQPATNGYAAPNGPTIWVTAMYAHNGDHCARNDHLWGMGTTCNDAVGATQQRYMMWSGT